MFDCLLVHCVELILPEECRLTLYLLNLLHQLLDPCLKTLLVFFLRLGVVLKFVSELGDRDLQLAAGIFTFTDEFLILSHIVLKIIEYP